MKVGGAGIYRGGHARPSGRVVKNTGDGVLAEFVSVVDAVRCAAEMQRGMLDREPAVPRKATSLAMESMSRHVSKRWQNPAECAFRASCTIRFAASCPTHSMISGSKASRTSLSRCGPTRSGPTLLPICR